MSTTFVDGFEILDARSSGDVERWTALWQSWPAREVQGHPGYARLFEDDTSRAVAAAYVSPEGCVLYPLLLRDITTEEGCSGAANCADLIVPYGYGGPFSWNYGDSQALAAQFWAAFSEWAHSQNIVSEFVRFSLFEELLLPYPGTVDLKQMNVVRQLDMDEDSLWMDFDHDVRTNVNKAQRFGLRVEHDMTGSTVDEFTCIYYHTMERRSAEQVHYRPRSFFEQIHQTLQGQFSYHHAILEDKVVSTELVLLSEDTAYAFLGGTETSAFQYRPNDLLRYEIICWARELGKRRYVLGGGYLPNDGIFRFKKGFAPKGLLPFRTGRRILQPELYDHLVATKREMACTDGVDWSPKPDYFPAYRG